MRDGVTVIQISGTPLTLDPGRSLSSSNPTCISINGTDIRFNEPAVLTNEGMGILSLVSGKEYETFHFPEIEKSSLLLG
jgi:hypothetical protein